MNKENNYSTFSPTGEKRRTYSYRYKPKFKLVVLLIFLIATFVSIAVYFGFLKF